MLEIGRTQTADKSTRHAYRVGPSQGSAADPYQGETGGEGVRSFFLARLSGIPTLCAASFGDVHLSRLAGEIASLSRKLGSSKDQVSAALHTAVGVCEDPTRRRELLKYRRDLFNLRTPDVALRVEEVSERDRKTVQCFEEQLQLLRALEATLAEAYQKEWSRETAWMTTCARNSEVFGKGVAAASGEFARRLPTLQTTGVLSRGERTTLLRYLTRASAKATPFSHLGVLAPGSLAEVTRWPLEIVASSTERRSVVRANKRILAGLLAGPHGARLARDGLTIEDSLTEVANGWVWVARVDDREVIRSGPRSDVLELVFRIVGSKRPAELSHVTGALIEAGMTHDDAACLVERLLNAGALIRCSSLVDQEEEWVALVGDCIADQDRDSNGELIAALETTQAVIDRYATSTIQERVRECDHLDRVWRAVLTDLGSGRRRLPKPLVYEDVFLDAHLHVRRSRGLRDALTGVASFAKCFQGFGGYSVLLAELRRRFDANFKAGTSMPLVEFYRLAHSPGKPAEHDRASNAPGGMDSDPIWGPFSVVPPKWWLQWRAEVKQLQTSAWTPDSNQLGVATCDLHALRRRHGSSGEGRFSGTAMVAPVVENADVASLVLRGGRIHPGFGKYWSRHRDAVPEVARLLAVESSSAGPRLAEIGDDACFTGNLHGTWTGTSIPYPGAPPPPRGVERLPLNDLWVSRDPEDPRRLRLSRGGEEWISPIDVGFLGTRYRHPLFHLLAGMGSTDAFAFPVPVCPHDTYAARKDVQCSCMNGVIRRPRIVIDEALVVARASWRVPPTSDLTVQPGESPEQHFTRANDWRLGEGIPDHAFLRLDDRGALTTAERRKRQPQNWHKPQFLSFASPSLVTLLGQALGDAPEGWGCIIEECLPDLEGGARAGTDHYATELVLDVRF